MKTICAVILLGILCFFAVNPPLPQHRGFIKLEWSDLQGFISGGPGLLQFDPAADSERVRRAETKFFELAGTLVEFQIAGNLSQPAHIVILTEDGATLSDYPIPSVESKADAPQWSAERVSIPPERIGQKARVVIRAKPSFASRHWLTVRERVDFYTPDGIPIVERSRPFFQPFELAFLVLLALLIASAKPPGRVLQFALFFGLACVFHLRTAPFFYWDEWHVLERFGKLGLPGVIYTHNEHFLPLFFSWYYFETRLLGDHYLFYLIISALLHALNAVLLVAVLRRVGEELPLVDRAAFLLGCLFVANSLHAETQQWAFEQTILLCQLFSFAAMIHAWDFVKSGRASHALVAACCALVAPLCFGNGFSLSLQLAVILSLLLRGEVKPRLMRMAALLACTAVFAGAAAYLYKTHEVSAGHGVEAAKPFADLAAVAEYLATGTQHGAILRGLGGNYHEEALVVWASSGFGMSLVCLAVGMLNPARRRAAARFWICGQALLFACMLLPALGRWQLGAVQSLSLRYHYSTLLGVCVLVLPAVVQLLEWSRSSESRRLLRMLAPLCLMLAFGAHYVASRRFTYFTKHGYEHRLYAAQLLDWKRKVNDVAPAKPDIDYEASGTALAGLYPLHPSTITPGRHPNDIYAVLEWLRK